MKASRGLGEYSRLALAPAVPAPPADLDEMLLSRLPAESDSITLDYDELQRGQEPVRIGGALHPPFQPRPPALTVPTTTNQLQDMERRVLRALWSKPESLPFRRPVDTVELGIPDYHDIIKTPMDLGTIKKRLAHGWYRASAECVRDFQMVFNNCYVYNKPHTPVYQAAEMMEKVFNELLREAPNPETEEPLKKPAPHSHKKAKPKKKKSSIQQPDSASPPTSRRKPIPTAKPTSQPSTRAVLQCADQGGKAPEAPWTSGPLLAGTDPLRYAKKLLDELMGPECRALAAPFLQPMEARDMTGSVVKYPVDLTAIRGHLHAGHYRSAHEFAADVRLMFTNCYRVLPAEHQFVALAKQLQRIFEVRFANFPEEGYATVRPDSPMPGARVNRQRSKVATGYAEDQAQVEELEKQIQLYQNRLDELRGMVQSGSEAGSLHPVSKAKKAAKKAPCMKKAPVVSKGTNCDDTQSPVSTRESSEEADSPGDEAGGVEECRPGAASTVPFDSDEESVEMGYDRKRALTLEINKLPAEKLSRLVDILRQNEPVYRDLMDKDELEIDLNVLQSKTCRLLEELVRSGGRKRGRKVGSGNVRRNPVERDKRKESLQNMLQLVQDRLSGRPPPTAPAVPAVTSDSEDSASAGSEAATE